MKNLIKFAILVVLFTSSCTKNERARNYGGSEIIDLPKNQKLINVTWKETNLWYLTKPMTESDTAEVYTFNEVSSFGVWEGTIVIKESK